MKAETYTLILIGCMSLTTVVLRSLPFWCFSDTEKFPEKITFLSEVLPPATLGMLVVYCLRDISFSSTAEFLSPVISALSVVLIQVCKRNTVLSVIGGTFTYLLLSRIL